MAASWPRRSASSLASTWGPAALAAADPALAGRLLDAAGLVAAQLGIPFVERDFQVYNVINADEAFTASTPYCLLPVTKITTSPLVLAVNPATGIKSVPELVASATKDPGKLNFSTSGVGTVQNLGPQYFFTLAGLTKDHAVGIHYKSGGDVTTALLGGQVQSYVSAWLGPPSTFHMAGSAAI